MSLFYSIFGFLEIEILKKKQGVPDTTKKTENPYINLKFQYIHSFLPQRNTKSDKRKKHPILYSVYLFHALSIRTFIFYEGHRVTLSSKNSLF